MILDSLNLATVPRALRCLLALRPSRPIDGPGQWAAKALMKTSAVQALGLRRRAVRTTLLTWLAASALTLVGVSAHAHRPHAAHVHGAADLGVVVDGAAMTLQWVSPLETLLGFERAPRTDAEKDEVNQMLARLRAAYRLFVVDPAARCTLEAVHLQSAVLGLGPSEPLSDGHAELQASISFRCADAGKAKFIDTTVFQDFPALRRVNVELVTPRGQFKRKLTRAATRLAWGT